MYSRPLCACRALWPLVGQHGVNSKVSELPADTFAIAENTLLLESEALGDRTAASVIDVGTNLDPVELPDHESMVDECLHRAGHRAAALCRFGQPIANAACAVLPRDAVETDHPGDLVLNDDSHLETVIVCQLIASTFDKGLRVLECLAGSPRHPP